MLGSTVVMKAAKKGYRKYGLPGAIVAGLGTLLGIRFIKRKLDARSQRQEQSGDESTDSASQ